MGVLHSSRAQLAATNTKSTFTAMVRAKMPHPSEWAFFLSPLSLNRLRTRSQRCRQREIGAAVCLKRQNLPPTGAPNGCAAPVQTCLNTKYQLFATRAYATIAHHPHNAPCPLHADAQNHTMILEPAAHDGRAGHALECLLGFGMCTAANKPSHGHIPNAGACQTWQMRAVRGRLRQVHGLTSINANACTLWANNPDVRRRQTTRQNR